MTHTLDQLKAMTDAQLSRLAFELGLAPDNVKLCTDEGCDPQTWAEESEPHEYVYSWLPPNQEHLDQTFAMLNEHFKRGEDDGGAYWSSGSYWQRSDVTYGQVTLPASMTNKKGAAGYIDFIVELPADQEARCLTIAAILAKEAMK